MSAEELKVTIRYGDLEMSFSGPPEAGLSPNHSIHGERPCQHTRSLRRSRSTWT
jgi:hypothetical protein